MSQRCNGAVESNTFIQLILFVLANSKKQTHDFDVS
jgi:hypothetical protein